LFTAVPRLLDRRPAMYSCEFDLDILARDPDRDLSPTAVV
jgi:hypothetical protein